MDDCRRFQDQSFVGDVEAEVGYGAGDEKSEVRRTGDGNEERLEEEQFQLFSKMVREYIVDGAPNEINIR